MKKSIIILLAASLSTGLSAGVMHRVCEPLCLVEKATISYDEITVAQPSQVIFDVYCFEALPEAVLINAEIQVQVNAEKPWQEFNSLEEIPEISNRAQLWFDPGLCFKAEKYALANRYSFKLASSKRWLECIRQC